MPLVRCEPSARRRLSVVAARHGRAPRPLRACAGLAAALVAIAIAACAPQRVTPPTEAPAGSIEPRPDVEPRADRVERGRVSLYGPRFEGRPTASGQPFDPEALTMAHRTLPFGTRVRVTNLANRRSVEVVVNDRGPLVAGRIADVSLAAARALGMLTDGVVDAVLEIIAPATR